MLDGLNAEECGDSVAFLRFDVSHDLSLEMQASLEKSVEVDSRTRIYIIFTGDDKKMRGRFLFGQRKAAPWTGFAPRTLTKEDEDVA